LTPVHARVQTIYEFTLVQGAACGDAGQPRPCLAAPLPAGRAGA